MHIYFLQHSDYGTPARLADWLTGMGHSYNICALHRGEVPPRPEDVDGLIVLGGPMGPHDDESHPWLKRERKLIDRLLKSSKPLMGVGLGAELIADAMGAVVSRAPRAEIGWHDITRSDEAELALPPAFCLFQWHTRIFGLPDDCAPIGHSAACPVQGFSWDDNRVIALQGHIEATRAWAQAHYAALTLPEGLSSQDEATALEQPRLFDHLAPLLDRIMVAWTESVD
ncbi:type 1 glutamine amidotransferase [Larsenimonas rhizosphaerae]|uniref:Type 1 glutamine amidotransferase n=1 Tax=Larsenimonas rhizosphaerae TaxID=2944682 RepID=A0AA42CV11_9GAMM|nr:type 1 glutamine amidotransferase [Larsenimonas rhizosphaerae]MCX2525217.1 type 1 glutamine amidotransferase [Larsenimonas rhizosphaerae]